MGRPAPIWAASRICKPVLRASAEHGGPSATVFEKVFFPRRFGVRFIAKKGRLAVWRGTQERAGRCFHVRAGRRVTDCTTEITMKPTKSVLASLAVAGLLLSQPAAAASAVRAGSSTGDSEELAGVPGAAIPAIIAILAVAIVAVVSASNDDNKPVSP
jgi:hypothetical protein